MDSSHLLKILYFATVCLVLMRSVLPLIAVQISGIRRAEDDFR